MNEQTFPNPFKTELPDDAPLIIMTRTFHAPLALVWTVWTQPEHVALWWGFGNNEVAPAASGGSWAYHPTGRDGPCSALISRSNPNR